ncbi:hypothetical protein H632_c1107p1 [Helicosporidium sp. ATCC 50920]|nr:hypothetical protein H632_c1107p1 [Helicosporidium sp. ATCC 50920]|eukprot:KDD74733.1 hypothetical protein H632_c1107p1 [Helicosporidium sp. ATCC 50920]
MASVEQVVGRLGATAGLNPPGALRCTGPMSQSQLQSLVDDLVDDSTAESLDLSGCDLGDAAGDVLSRVVAFNTSLHSIFLRNNGIGSNGAQCLANALQSYNSGALRTLDLQGRQRLQTSLF